MFFAMEEEIKMSTKEFESLVTGVVSKALDEKVKEVGMDKIDRKFAMYPGSVVGMTDDEIKGLDKKDRAAKFVKAVFHKDIASLALMKAMNETTGSAGGFLVPQEFSDQVYRIVEDFGLIARFATKFPMISDTLNIPRVSASVTVSYPGEATAGTESQPTFEQVQLLIKECVGLSAMSNPLLADANVNVVDQLANLFAEAIAGSQDNQGFTGSGSPFTGIFNDTGVTVVNGASGDTTFTKCATPDYARQLIANVKPWSLSGAAFYMHRSVWQLMQVTKASTAGSYLAGTYNPPLTVSGVQQMGQPAGMLWGYPVYLSDKLPTTTAVSTKFIIFGNLAHMFMGTRGQLMMDISQHASLTTSGNLFEKNMSAVRVIDRHSLAVGLPAAFAVLKTAAS